LEGKTLSHFRILSRLGEGGMGVVYKAEDLKLQRVVAIKVLQKHLVSDPERAARFLKEARAAAAVTHASIATVHEIDDVDGVTFIAMELVEGDTLRELMSRKELSLGHAMRLAREIAEGLAAAHGAGIVHRDLKPDNIIVTPEGHAKIIDFGLARLLEAQHPPTSEEDETLADTRTREGTVIGTPAYMSPEQARGLEVDFRTDLFSFGSMLYEMVTGMAPFKAATTTDVLSDILHKSPPQVSSINPAVPSSVQWILDKCLEKEADRRYQDTRDLVVDLQHLPASSGSDIGSGSVVLPSREADAARPLWKQPIPLALAALVVVVAILGVPRLLGPGQGTAPIPEANSLAVFAFENLKDAEDPERLGQILQELLITDLSGGGPAKVFSSQRLYDLQKQVQGAGAASLRPPEAGSGARCRAGPEQGRGHGGGTPRRRPAHAHREPQPARRTLDPHHPARRCPDRHRPPVQPH
jgi:serine/threonine protein kinase